MPLIEHASQPLGRALSVGIFLKILGIGVLVATIFGGVTLLTVRDRTSQALLQMARQRADSVAQLLAMQLAEPMIAKDTARVEEILRQARAKLPDLRWLVVSDGDRRVVSRQSSGDSSGEITPQVPSDFAAIDPQHQRRAPFDRQKSLFEVVWPIVDSHQPDAPVGLLQLGIQDRTIWPQLAAATQSVFWTLLLCAAIGIGLAALLSYLITHLKKEEIRLTLIKKIVHVQENERKIISLELHDQLGQSLLALLLTVQSLRQESRLSGDSLHDLEVQIRKVLEEVRRLAWGMRPSVLDDYGLDKALTRLVEETEQHSHLDIDYQFSGPPDPDRLPAEMEVALYRIVQEAFTNIVRHAGAAQASLIVLWQRREVTLVIEDNGRGFDGDAATRGGGSLGLTGMKERAALLGGRCTVESVAGQGTTLRVKIPLGKAGNP